MGTGKAGGIRWPWWPDPLSLVWTRHRLLGSVSDLHYDHKGWEEGSDQYQESQRPLCPAGGCGVARATSEFLFGDVQATVFS